MPINLNMGNVTSEPLPDGMYQLRCTEVQLRKSQAGNDTLNVKFEVMQPEEFVMRVVWDNFTLVPQSLWVLQKFLEAITDKEWQEDDMDLDENELVGLFVRASIVQQDAYNKPGRVAKVREYFPDEF